MTYDEYDDPEEIDYENEDEEKSDGLILSWVKMPIKSDYGIFDIWVCSNCGEFESSIKFKSNPRCPKCKSQSLAYQGQVAR